MPIYALADIKSRIDPTAWMQPEAVVNGDVVLGPKATARPCEVLRGGIGQIEIGRTSVQDGSVIHTTADQATIVGSGSVIGHGVRLEGCSIGDAVLIGSNASVLPCSLLGRGAVVAARAVVTQGTEIAPGALARGVPTLVTPDAKDASRALPGVERYTKQADCYRLELRRLDPANN